MITHILNGDALADKFPHSIEGERIVLRECFCDGPLKSYSDGFESFMLNRATFLKNKYQTPINEYLSNTKCELLKLSQIPLGSNIYFWFEEDLFCQINFWFALHYIYRSGIVTNCFLVLPHTDIKYGFGGLDETGLIQVFEQAKKLTYDQVNCISNLWPIITTAKKTLIKAETTKECEGFEFVPAALKLYCNTLPQNSTKTVVHQQIQEIIDGLEKVSFGNVFRKFWAMYPEYGFGDLQVKRYYDELLAK